MNTSEQLWKGLLMQLAGLVVVALLSLLFANLVPAPDARLDPHSPWALPQTVWEGRW